MIRRQEALYLLVFPLLLALLAAPIHAQDPEDEPQLKVQQEVRGPRQPRPMLAPKGRLLKIFAGQSPRDSQDVRAMQKHIRLLVDKLSPATVGVGVGAAQGSGVIIDEDGHVLTAAHVAGRPGRTARIFLPDGRTLTAKTLGMNRSMDAGMLRIEMPEDQEERAKLVLPVAEMAPGSEIQLGQWCLALGHPGGFEPDRPPVVRVGRVVHKYKDVVTTDCTLIGGDSGGPLFDMYGRVIGIHSRIGPQLVHNVHVPIQAFEDSWDRLASGELWGNLPGRPFIGVRGSEESDDAIVTEVVEGGPAQKAGIVPGDRIIQFGDREISTFEQLVLAVGVRRPGEKVKVIVQREDDKLEVEVEVGQAGGTSQPNAQRLQAVRTNSYPGLMQYIAMVRTPGVNEKNHEEIRGAFASIADDANRATVRISEDKKKLAMGVIVDSDGLIITKASQVVNKEGELRPVMCRLADGREFEMKLLGVKTQHDIALLKIDARKLPVVRFSDEGDVPLRGSWLISAGAGEKPISIGVVSVAPKEVRGGVLGILLGEAEKGAVIERVLPGGGGAQAGLKPGDVVLKVNGEEMADRQTLIDTVRSHLPGEQLTLEVRREEETLTIKATLMRLSDVTGGRPVVQNNLGGPLSERRTGFVSVLQHDSVVQPNECGGVVVDVSGNAIGINIARAGRIATYALPAKLVLEALEELKP